jgi:hypothetical protein
MYPSLSLEMLAQTFEILCYLSTVAAALISCVLTARF